MAVSGWEMPTSKGRPETLSHRDRGRDTDRFQDLGAGTGIAPDSYGAVSASVPKHRDLSVPLSLSRSYNG